MNRPAILLISSLIFAGCAANSSAPVTVTPATAEQKAALLDRVKSLAGTWEPADPKGDSNKSIVFAVTSAGSAVREIMHCGEGMEMTNMYYMDGPSLVMVHYCAMGNQPHMRATASAGDRIAFKFDGVSNLTSPDEEYMGEMTLVFKDNDNIREEWHAFTNGKIDEKPTTFDLKRKKS